MELTGIWYFKTQGRVLGPILEPFIDQFQRMCDGDAFALARRGDWSYWLPVDVAIATAVSQRQALETSDERRKTPRIRLSGAVILQANTELLRGSIKDISTSGLGLQISAGDRIAKDTTIQISLPTTLVASGQTVKAKVIRLHANEDGTYAMGLEFIDLPESIRESILDLFPYHPERLPLAG